MSDLYGAGQSVQLCVAAGTTPRRAGLKSKKEILAMIDDKELPEGTDHIITGASAENEAENDLIVREPTARDKVREQVRSGGEKIAGQAADKARGLVAQGIERSSEALGNVSRLVGDTAEGLDERLGPEYGDYARKAAGAIENAASSLAAKDPDELIDDTRNFVRKSPGVALAGAAVIGFALVRLVKSGLGEIGERSGGKSGKKKS
jgi:hypothetical protein